MNIPFSSEQFLQVFTQYNTAVWPSQILLNIAALAVIALVFAKTPDAGRIASYGLALLWLWTGIVYHLLFFTSINPAAYVFGTLFIVQGFLFLWAGGIKNKISFSGKSDLRGYAASALVFYGLVLYPLIGYWLGHRYPQSPTFGAPCPTTIFTFGILLWAGPALPRYLLIIPALWSIVGFSAAFNFGIREDIGLLIAGISGTLLLAVRKRETANPQGM